MLKKWLSLWLCILLSVGLCACSGDVQDPQIVQQQEALASADTFLEAGDYEGAIAALESMDVYRRISERITKAEEGLREQQLDEFDWLFDITWYAFDRDMQVTFHRQESQTGEWVMDYAVTVGEAGTFTRKEGQIPVVFRGGQCILLYFSDFETVFLSEVPATGYQQDGIPVLNLGGIEFATEDFAQISAVETVEITMDNWQEYFEIKTVETWLKDDFGEVSDLEIVTYVALKEEYLDRVDLENSNVTVGYCHGWNLMNCTLDLQTPSYKLKGIKSSYPEENKTFVLPQRLGDYNGYYPDCLGGIYYGSYDTIIHAIAVATNYRITKITGTLAIR